MKGARHVYAPLICVNLKSEYVSVKWFFFSLVQWELKQNNNMEIENSQIFCNFNWNHR